MRNLLAAVQSLTFILLLAALSASGQSHQSLGAALNPDGSVKRNVTGSFDPSGFKLAYGPKGEPRFVESTNPLGTGCNDGWENMGFTTDGANFGIRSVVADGAGNVYVGGAFNAIYNTPAKAIAKWNGTTWSPLGSGILGTVFGIAVSGSDVYAAGTFETAGGIAARNIAKWNGSSWSAMGPGVGGQNTQAALAVAVSGTTVYAGGEFGIARWDGVSWSTLEGGTNGAVHALAVSGSDVYVGGFFTAAGTLTVAGIARWDGTAWFTLGSGLARTGGNPQVEAIAISGSDVYVGGTFTEAGGNPAINIAKWNGTSWSALGSGTPGGRVTAITTSGSDVYVGGFFRAITGGPGDRIAKWTGSQWQTLGSGIGPESTIVYGIAVLGSTLVVGGEFSTAGGNPARNVAIWSGSSWSSFTGNSLDSIVRGVAVSGTDVYVVGNFTKAGSLVVNSVAKWNGSVWSALGTGTLGFVNAVAVSGNNVYIGGNFSSVGGTNANNIARWNGSNWSPLGSGISGGTVATITIAGEDIYVGGAFVTAGGAAANKIAKWNGTSWAGLNSPGFLTSVVTIAPAGNLLYVGAATNTSDSPNYFLKYDGTTWTPLGNGMSGGGVSSIAVSGNDVYVAGSFTSVGGVAGTVRVAKWNNGTWSALGTGLPAAFGTSSNIKIAMAGSELIAMGDFRTGAGGPADHIARWTGSSWLPMGAGLNYTGAGAISVAGGDIYIGGEFLTAGCYASPYFARWRENVWTGAASADWHSPANWGGGAVALPNTGVTISASNATISSADVTVSSLLVTSGRNLAIAGGRTLTVTGNVQIDNAAITGPGTLIVNGNVQMNGDLFGLASVTINGALTLNAGRIDGGPVILTSCSAGALAGGSSIAIIQSPLTRCVNATGTFRFPVGTGAVVTGYSPVEVSGVSGSGNFTVQARPGGYPGVVAGLSANRLQRWWDTSATGITQANMVFNYVDSEVIGLEHRYRVFSINGGVATQLPTTLNQTTNRATVTGVTSFAAFTLAEGTPVPLTFNGRVTTASNRGAWGVTVSLTDGQGNTRSTVTNPFGYYRFFNVPTFNPYTVRVTSKKFTFAVPERIVHFDEFTTTTNFQSSDH